MSRKERMKENEELSAFEAKLVARVSAANKRLKETEDIESLSPELTIRRVKLRLQPRTVSGEEIKAARRLFGASQAVFAMYLQVNKRTLQEWEQGRSKVPGCASRLIGEILADANYWRERFKSAVQTEVLG